jgi:Predicted protein-tyrosine phosphatase
MTTNVQPPFPFSYWVKPRLLLAGRHPAAQPHATRHTLIALLSAGITRFIDLTAEDERPSYEPLLYELAAQEGREVQYMRSVIPDMQLPSHEQVRNTLDLIDQAHSLGQGVYLHCLAGIGRTGTLVGCYLVHQGLSGEEALLRINELRRNNPQAKAPSPETEAQRQFVRHWQG